MATVVTTITGLSTSAIATNGFVRGGKHTSIKLLKLSSLWSVHLKDGTSNLFYIFLASGKKPAWIKYREELVFWGAEPTLWSLFD